MNRFRSFSFAKIPPCLLYHILFYFLKKRLKYPRAHEWNPFNSWLCGWVKKSTFKRAQKNETHISYGLRISQLPMSSNSFVQLYLWGWIQFQDSYIKILLLEEFYLCIWPYFEKQVSRLKDIVRRLQNKNKKNTMLQFFCLDYRSRK